MAEVEIGKINKPNKKELIYDEEYRHSIVASSYTDQNSLLSNISGKPVLTEYYRQVLGESEMQHGFQPESIETYQSYQRIKGLIIKIDNDTSQGMDTETGIMNEEGVAFVLFDLTPILGDIFIADIGDGKAGLFQITELPRIRKIVMDKVYEIDFKIIAIMNKEIEDNLNKKTVKEFIYSKDSAIKGGNSVISVSDFDDNKTIAKLETAIAQDYLENFYFDSEKTIIIPNIVKDDKIDNSIVYDPYLTQFMQYTLPTDKIGLREPVRTMGVEFGKNGVGGRKVNIWDMILQNSFEFPQRYKQKYYIHNSSSLINTRYYGGIYFSKIDKCILNEEYGAARDAYNYYGSLLFNEEQNIKPVQTQGIKWNYYFSDEFYTGNPTKDNEKFIFNFFRDKTVDKKILLEILNKYWDLEPIDKCYMAGIYLLAIRISLSSTYNYI